MTATRRLAAIMFTDMVGYTAATQSHEAGSLERLQEQEELARPLFSAYAGREVKSTGDGFLVEFDSALKATQCAIEIQRRLHERNSQKSVDPIEVRIGIHVGDVEERGADIFGDAVNIAARVHPIAEPGGICVSAQVFDQVREKIPNALERLGLKSLKGVKVPTDLYKVVLPWDIHPVRPEGSETMRLAVLPFANMSPDPRDEYFADGLTEELITELSRVRGVRVIARTSVMRFKNSPKGVFEIGKELGVGAALEGSVRKAGQRLRITAQLIDAASEEHLWANQFDRDLNDIFSVQSEIASSICKALDVQVFRGDSRRNHLATKSVAAYDEYLRGRHFFWLSGESNYRTAIRHFEKALELDPTFAQAYCGLADTYSLLGNHGHVPLPQALRQAEEQVKKALQINPDLPEAHVSLAPILYNRYDWRGAEVELRRAIDLDPGNVLAQYWLAVAVASLGRAAEALGFARKAMELDPLSEVTNGGVGWMLYYTRAYDEAIAHANEMSKQPGFRVHNLLGSCHLQQGRAEQAITEFQAALADSRALQASSRARLANAYARAGRIPEAQSVLRALVAPEVQPPVPSGVLAMVHVGLGEIDRAFECFERAHEEGSALIVEDLLLEPLLDPIRTDPRYPSLLKLFNLPSEPS